MAEVKHTPVELHAVFNGCYWDVAVGPEDYSQCVGSCHANSALGYGLDGAERYARLFAAAPDLFEAARLAFYSEVGLTLAEAVEISGWAWPSDAPETVSPLAERLRAALSKATNQREGW